MHPVFPASGPTVFADAPAAPRSRVGRALEFAGRRTNMVAGVAMLAQFYTAGLAVFGAASFTAHARVGWLVQLASLLTLLLLLAARVPFRVSRWALLLFVLGVLQPILAFAFRGTPWAAALHPLNGVVMVGVCLFLEKALRDRR
jgi:hypothetical protein